MAYKQLTRDDRLRIEAMYKLKTPVSIMADTIGCNRSTIYRELPSGMYSKRNTDYTYTQTYSADIAQKAHDEKAALKGAPLKIGNDIEFANYIEEQILQKKYSPDVILGRIRREKRQFRTTICTSTLYSYIQKGIFLKLKTKHLHRGKYKKKHKKQEIRISYKNPLKTSIDKRPKEVEKRETFGHWEMDTVHGSQAARQSTSLLVLSERKTRQELILKLSERTKEEVSAAIDKLQRHFGDKFPQVFKTITVDNGSEFAGTESIEKNQRTKLYYCHPNCSWKRGTNENINAMIRRFIPKGTSIRTCNQEKNRADPRMDKRLP